VTVLFYKSSLREGNPITVLEAMSAGLKPIVITGLEVEKYLVNGFTIV